MADIDIYPFGPTGRGHDRAKSRPDKPTGESIPLPSVTPVEGSTWEPE